jgi:N-acetyl sugar amidotransferase
MKRCFSNESKMNRCRICIYPSTRPDTNFDDGICSACRSYADRKNVDWAERRESLITLLDQAKQRKAPYDVIVPVSGGKDSTFQVLTMLDFGMRVLAVNSGTDMLSDIGRRNLDNLKRFCDVIEYTPNVEVRKKLVRIGLFEVGDPSYPEHLAIWSIPTRIACMFDIPLVVWGEQPQREYATPHGVVPATHLDGAWVAQFGGMLGLRLSDIVGMEGLTEADLDVFKFPSDALLATANVRGIWLGEYIDWDGWMNFFVSQQFGFECLPVPVETSISNYENLDNHLTVLRDYLRYLKYGYTRATDIACNHIRRGRLTREKGLQLDALSRYFPETSLGKPIDEILAYFGLTRKQFEEQCEKWASLRE